MNKLTISIKLEPMIQIHKMLDKESKKKLLQEYKRNLLYLWPREKLSMSQNFSSLAQIVQEICPIL